MFSETLKSAVDRVDGALACVLMGFDGIAIDCAIAGDVGSTDPKEIATELSAHLQRLRKTTKETGQGTLEETLVRTGEMQAVVRVLDDDYLLLLMAPTAMVGKGRYVLRTVAPAVRQHL